MAAKDAKKTILVNFKEHKRVLTYSGDGDELKERVYQVFQDVIPTGTNVFLQIKDQEWDGVYLDLIDQDVPDKSWIRVCLHDDNPSVPAEPLATVEGLYLHIRITTHEYH